MVHIKLFIKNTLTNLFPTFYRGSHPINRQVLYAEKWQHQEFTCPLNTYPKSPVQNESEGKGGGVETVPIWVFMVLFVLKPSETSRPSKGFRSKTRQQRRQVCCPRWPSPIPDLLLSPR